MKKKKSATANQEKNKTIYLLVGLALSMAISIEWLEWGNGSLNNQYIKSSVLSFIDDEMVVELKTQPAPSPPKPRPVVSNPVIVEDDSPVKTEQPVEKKIINTITIKKELYNETDDDELELEDLDFEWDVVQQMPSFPGGEKNLFKFLKNNTDYPEISRQNGRQGKVIASFVVEKDGSISDIKILKGVDQYIDQESIKVIKAMPKWKPGKQMGKKVRVRQILPLKFTLMY